MRKQNLVVLLAAAGVVVTSGCTSMAADNSRAVASSDTVPLTDLEAAQRRVSELESTLADRDSTLASTQARLANAGSSDSMAKGDTSLFPPNPKAGECYARVLIPAKFRSSSDTVMVSEASERIEIIPARYTPGEERVLVREASTKLEVVPAVYEEVQERVLVKAASQSIREIPAKYDTVTERVLDQAAHTAWKKGSASLQAGNVLSQTTNDTGEIMCLVEVPATYKTVTKRVLATPARTEVTEIPAEYETVTKRVVVKPPTTREVTIPAEYDTVKVTKLVQPASEKRIEIPAKYETVARTEKVTEEQMEWKQVMCEVNMTASNVRSLQQALADKGFYNSSIDGIIGLQTLSAASAYARANNLPAGSNYVTMDVVKRLGIEI